MRKKTCVSKARLQAETRTKNNAAGTSEGYMSDWTAPETSCDDDVEVVPDSFDGRDVHPQKRQRVGINGAFSSSVDVCIICTGGGDQLLVCKETGCPVVLHDKCLNVEPNFNDSGDFLCPYCWYKKCVACAKALREKAMAAEKSLSEFIDAEIVGPKENETVVEVEGDKTDQSLGGIRHHSHDEDRIEHEVLRDKPVHSEKEQQTDCHITPEFHSVQVGISVGHQTDVCDNNGVGSELNGGFAKEGSLNEANISESREREVLYGEMESEKVEENKQNGTIEENATDFFEVSEDKERVGAEHRTKERNHDREAENHQGAMGEDKETDQFELSKDGGRMEMENTQNAVQKGRDHEYVASDKKKAINRAKEVKHGRTVVIQKGALEAEKFTDVEMLEVGERMLTDHKADDQQGKLPNGPCEDREMSADGSPFLSMEEAFPAKEAEDCKENVEKEKQKQPNATASTFSSTESTNHCSVSGPDDQSVKKRLRQRRGRQAVRKEAPRRNVGISMKPSASTSPVVERRSQKKNVISPKLSPAKRNTPIVSNERRKKLFWTVEEEKILKEGVEKISSVAHKNFPWRKVLEFGQHVFHETRTPTDLKDKWRNMMKGC